VTGPGVTNDFAADTILLGSERESDKGDAIQVGEVTRERIKTVVANEKLHIA
jgi:hypothetical protein